jgi:hypothetical protein
MLRWPLFAIVAIGCGQPAAPAQPRPAPAPAAPPDAAVAPRPPLADDIPQLALRARQLFIDWQAAFGDGSLDCATAAGRMNALAEKHADVIAANQQVLEDGHEKRKALRAELEKYEAEMEPVAKAIVESPVMARCSSDPDFGKAVDRLQGDR